jgi:hypothetical protein
MKTATKHLLVLAPLLLATAHAEVKVNVGGEIYPRFTISDMDNSFSLMGAGGIVTAQVTSRTRDIMTAALQIPVGVRTADWTSGFHFGDAYALIPLGLRWPVIRVGQAVIPFGLLADYDIHSQVVQPPYARTLGLRIDPGIGLLGRASPPALGPTGYWLWLSNGNGPYRMDDDNNKVVTVRVAPKFLLGNAEATVGLSGLVGSLPDFGLDSIAMAGPKNHVVKYRLGLDNTTDLGPLTIRVEGVGGKDSVWSGPIVCGYYAEARYAFVNWLEGLVKYDGFHVRGHEPDLKRIGSCPLTGSVRNLSAGVNFYPPGISVFNFQLAYGRDFIRKGNENESNWQVTAQLAIRF